MSLHCCFKSCKNAVLTQASSRVEIKSAVPTSGLRKYERSFLVSWKSNGEAIFHPECWAHLVTLARQKGSSKRKRKSAVNSPDHTTDQVMIHSEKVMVKEANKTVEKFDSAHDMDKYAIKVAEMVKKSNHCIFFTGAGISTSAGLGDYRGKGGKWTEQDREALDMDTLFENTEETNDGPSPKKIFCSAASVSRSVSFEEPLTEEKEEEEVMYENLRPTFTHEAVSKLVEVGHVKYLISQNCDGLHLLSGVPTDMMSELHGNVFVEKCEKCGRQYERSYYVCDDVSDMYLEELSENGQTDIIAPKFMKKCKTCGLSHRTGRRCEDKACSGFLMDTIINFGDMLEDSILDRAFEAANACDVMVCLGTTLKVTPANELVDYVPNPRRVVICNRQQTDKDKACQEKDTDGNTLGVRVYGDCDVFMKYLMLHLLGQKQFDAFSRSLETKANVYDKLRAASSCTS